MMCDGFSRVCLALIVTNSSTICRLAFADPPLEHVPVDPRTVHPAFLGRLVRRAAGVAQDLELHQPVDIFGRKSGFVELDAELLHTARRDSNHRCESLTDRQTPVNRGVLAVQTTWLG